MSDEGQQTSEIGLLRGEKFKIIALYSSIAAATLLGFLASLVVANISVVVAGLATVAFVLGLRHGMDADHIAAIDNVTRKLIQEGRRPLTVGAWFSLGHSTVVLLMIVALVIATRTIVNSLPFLQSGGAFVGTTVSGVFLLLIGLINTTIVIGLYRAFRQTREGSLTQLEIENLMSKAGLLSRYFGPLFRIVSAPWKIYPIGLLFGLGFDTASEIALIAISVGVGISASLPLWMILLLPFMFTCGMVLVDTTDGMAMRLAYGWAMLRPMRKLYYNLTITVISVLVALAIGVVEILQAAGGELGLKGPFWSFLETLDFETLGIVVVGLFVATWLFSLSYWKYKRYDEMLLSSA